MLRNKNLSQSKMSRMLVMVLNGLAVAIAIVLLMFYSMVFIAASFNISFGIGLRSLAAAILPFAVIFYINFFTPMLQMKSKIPLFNLYFVFTLWTVGLLSFISTLYHMAFPLGELLFSCTLALTAWRYGSRSFNAFVSCCYGIVTGTLIHIAFAGLPLINSN